MGELNLYKKRQPHKITVDDGEGNEKELLLPQEFTLNEEERIEEYEIKVQEKSKEEVPEDDKKAQEKVMDEYWNLIYQQLLILFQHYQPEITFDDLKKYLSKREATEIIEFFQENRFNTIKENSSEEKAEDFKKKPQEND